MNAPMKEGRKGGKKGMTEQSAPCLRLLRHWISTQFVYLETILITIKTHFMNEI